MQAQPHPRASRAPLVTAAAALLVLGACGSDDPLEGADTTGSIPNAAGANAPRNYDTAASPGGPDSTTGKADAGSSRRPAPAGDTLTVRPQRP
jgi:hypothetical protein